MLKFQPIPLDRRNDGCGVPCCSPDSGEGLNLFVSHPRVVDLPEEGTITFRFRRGPATIREPFKDQEGSASVDLTLLEICSVDGEEIEDLGAKKDETAERIDKLFAEARSDKD